MQLKCNTIGKIDLTFNAIQKFIDDVRTSESNQDYRYAVDELADTIMDLWEHTTALKRMQWKDLYNRGCNFELVKAEDTAV